MKKFQEMITSGVNCSVCIARIRYYKQCSTVRLERVKQQTIYTERGLKASIEAFKGYL